MSLSFCVLGSGSSGNATLLHVDSPGDPRFLLLDAGLSPRETAKRLAPLGLTLADISHILVTHLDADHLNIGWVAGLERHDIHLCVHQRHAPLAGRIGFPVRRTSTFRDHLQLGPLCVHALLFAHDDLGTVGFILDHDGRRLAFATDLGRIPPSLAEALADVHALAIESNYDRNLQITSARPDYLKRRIMGGQGHLSNEQCLDLVLAVAQRAPLEHIALLHLSRQCNDPRIIHALYADRAPHLLDRLTITSQYTPTPMLRINAAASSAHPQPRTNEQTVLF